MIELVGWIILSLLALSVVGVMTTRFAAGRLLVYGGSLMLCGVLLFIGLTALGGPVQRLALPLGLPWIGTHLRLDALSAFFLALVGLGGGGASLFALGYGRHEAHPGRVLPFYPAFLAAISLVVVADDAFLFLFGWELMSLTSWALVMAGQGDPGHGGTRAGFVYLTMATFSGLTLLLAFGLLAGASGGYAFEPMRAGHPDASIAALVFILALIGAGSKAGLVPLHVWLPLAHPAAPSHVSALMSGVMTKVAVYGFIRIIFDLLAPPSWWAATVVLALGGITAVIGVLHAMMERDLKRLLAYSTVENIGIVFIGLGLALAFRANGFGAGAALAMTAALFHALNHTLFKSLLFFGAGAVLNATGERDMEMMGGLIHRMPRTAVAFLAGCVAVSALPPLNGFASEWLTFQAVLLRPEMPQWGLKLMLPVDGALLALAAALAAACFVRAFGICFLGRPRSESSASRPGERSLVGVRDAGLCRAMPAGRCRAGRRHRRPGARGADADRRPYAGSAGRRMADHRPYRGQPQLVQRPSGVRFHCHVDAAHGRLGASRVARVRRAPAWDCGFPDAGVSAQYSAGSFAQPIRRVFGAVVFQASDTVDMPAPGDDRAASITHSIRDPVWDGVYAPLGRAVTEVAGRMNVLQFLTIRRYLGFVFGALVVLLLTLALWQ